MNGQSSPPEGLSFHAQMAKVRGRIRREIAKAEDEEHEGGELNLVPYMDILVNTIIFLLATTASALALANINVNVPRYEEPTTGAVSAEQKTEKPKLNLTVAISYKGFILAGSGGVLTDTSGSNISIKCTSALKHKRCPAFLITRTNEMGDKERVWVDKYDYKKLEEKVKKVKDAYPKERQVIMTADRLIPFKVVVRAMDTLRGKSSLKCTGKDGCMFDRVILSAGVQ